jgi:hypothetical protein
MTELNPIQALNAVPRLTQSEHDLISSRNARALLGE